MLVTREYEDLIVVPVLVERLAASLFYAFHLPEGKELVSILGKGTEPDNLTALENWVMRQLGEVPERCTVAMMNALIEALDKQLRRYEVVLWS